MTKIYILEAIIAFVFLAAGSFFSRKNKDVSPLLFVIGGAICSFLDYRYEEGLPIGMAMIRTSLTVALVTGLSVLTVYLLRKMFTDDDMFGNGSFSYFTEKGGGIADIMATFFAGSAVARKGSSFPWGITVLIIASFCNAWYVYKKEGRKETRSKEEIIDEIRSKRLAGNAYMFIPSVMSAYCIALCINTVVWLITRMLHMS